MWQCVVDFRPFDPISHPEILLSSHLVFKMQFESESSDGGEVSCFCDSGGGSRKGVDGAPIRRPETEFIQLASVRNKAICFRETSNYNRRQRKLANFLTLNSDSGSCEEGTQRRNGDWIMCLNNLEGSVKTYPWTTTTVKQKFELVPWRKQKRQLDIINYTAWEPDELTSSSDANGMKARKYKQHPTPASHNQEIRRLIRLRFLFTMELQRQKQLKMISQRGRSQLPKRNNQTVDKEDIEDRFVIPQRQFESRSEEDRDSACDTSSFYDDPQELASNFVGYFGSENHHRVDGGNASASGDQKESMLDEEFISDQFLSEEFNYSDWLACCDSFRCTQCKRYC